jgi:multiple antibiotic resistance protein
VTIYLSYRFAGPLAGFLGKTGINVLVRLSAFILTCIGIQIAWSGFSTLIASLPH